ncbi:MAG TPA: DUF72 domain-containing protein [Bryobacteraceae bacterium]|jgi:uncharacterized protein YecE (DUF72 family)|nr:DUF72 domain-containing protein [Bryobacteraceae bacterium]
MAQIFAGTSGFAYPQWKPQFYPADVPAKKFLSYYAQRLNCVEINYTFRRMPAAATLASWVEATPPGFVFALKAHQRITHILRLKNADGATDLFLRAIDPLRSARRLGPLLFQLPPQMRADRALLADFLALLPADLRYAFEFRHTSWLEPGIYDLLAQHGAALCVAESEKLEVPEVITADFIYFRLRKPEYTAADIEGIAVHAGELRAQGRDLYLMFKHEETPDGALHAETILRKLGAA